MLTNPIRRRTTLGQVDSKTYDRPGELGTVVQEILEYAL